MKYTVNLLEYERGWGSRLDAVETFDTYEEAKKYKDDFNAKNTEEVVPDWYMIAEGPFEKE